MSRLLIYMPALNEGKTIVAIIFPIQFRKELGTVRILVLDNGCADNTSQFSIHAEATVLRHPVKNLAANFQIHA